MNTNKNFWNSMVIFISKPHVVNKKYVKRLIQIWPESIDPLIIYHEDIAIATNPLIFWETVNYSTPQTFVDVGCGNEGLVYVSTIEGHSGFGVDVRKSKIWVTFPDTIKLRVYTVTPSSVSIFLYTNSIIGNHSDELTPWMPVMAAKSDYKCNFFLLPCYSYSFDVTKNKRKDSSLSQSNDYLKYVEQICDHIGYKTRVDGLKIPSAKRIRFVSNGRVYEEKSYKEYLGQIEEIISDCVGKAERKYNVKTREPVEKVRNCTQKDRNIAESIFKWITRYLLMNINLESQWSFLTEDMLQTLKSESLQTLLNNNHDIFNIQKEIVQLRYPKIINEVKSKKEMRQLKF